MIRSSALWDIGDTPSGPAVMKAVTFYLESGENEAIILSCLNQMYQSIRSGLRTLTCQLKETSKLRLGLVSLGVRSKHPSFGDMHMSTKLHNSTIIS